MGGVYISMSNVHYSGVAKILVREVLEVSYGCKTTGKI